jgi:deoxyribonuclease-1-like protein
VSRRLALFVLASMFGGGWFYMGGEVPKQLGGHPGSAPPTYNAAYNNAPAPSQASSGFALPTFFGGQAATTPANATIRIASFNIQVFGTEKAKYAGIMQTLAGVIHNFQIVAIQEIRTKDDYFLTNFLRDYVNAGGARQYDYVIGPRLGRSSSKEQYAFIYDTAAIEVNRQTISTVNDPQDLMHREPFFAQFRVRGPVPNDAFTFILVNVHTDPDETDEELDTMADVYLAVRQSSGGEDDIVLLGDFNVDENHLGRLGKIPGIRPIVNGVPTNTRQNAAYDNIIVHQQSTAEFTGRWGVFDFRQLFNPPLSLDMAQKVSDHLPVWAEFSAYESTVPGRVAGRPDATAR